MRAKMTKSKSKRKYTRRQVTVQPSGINPALLKSMDEAMREYQETFASPSAMIPPPRALTISTRLKNIVSEVAEIRAMLGITAQSDAKRDGH
jgi:hypothetical protein